MHRSFDSSEIIVFAIGLAGASFIAYYHVNRLILRFRNPKLFRAMIEQERKDDEAEGERGGMFG